MQKSWGLLTLGLFRKKKPTKTIDIDVSWEQQGNRGSQL